MCSNCVWGQRIGSEMLIFRENSVVDHWHTCDQKVAGLIPGRGSRRIFFTRISFLW